MVFDKTAFVKTKKIRLAITLNKTLSETQLKEPKILTGKYIPAYELKKSQEKNPRTKSLERFAKCL